MSTPPLRLEHYFCTEVHLKANPNFKHEDFKDGKMDFSVKSNVQGGAHKDNPHKFQITLEIKIEPQDERPLPYDASVTFVGFFDVNPAMPHDEASNLVGVTGSSILYSATREYLLTLMGRGPWGGMILPTISFANVAKKKADSTATK